MKAVMVANLKELKVFAEKLVKKYPDGAVIGLSGDLGAGKTTFVRACVECLGDKSRVMSPTYVLHQSYSTRPRIDHLDLYRLDSVDRNALVELQYFDILATARQEKGFLMIEWPEKAKDLKLLSLDLHLKFKVQGEGRVIELSSSK